MGHALELCYAPGDLPHGLAICWGMQCCLYVASQLGLMDRSEVARHDGLIHRLLPDHLPQPAPTIAEVMQRVMRDGKRGRADESNDECACVLLRAVGKPLQTDTMLSKFPATFVADWLRALGLRP